MTVDPRAALDRLVAALEAHYNAVATRRSDDDPAVDDAYDVLADAYEVYEDALATRFGEVTPFYLAEDLDDEDDDGNDEDEDDDLDFDFEDELADVDDAEPAGEPAR
ncbi:primosomal protein [Myceligenerans pegani]|uniref:Primosomal protein n=1 Tax=Myceligenerans pegani TaxID=2776917 RepID=A0ABR9MZA1_9MICO|nr:primosomal protein [Myceligenerans sp. TRM 65318]MBE1876719.1 primosomal protein [Myceligenerans sp. TRM 65318]MBE3018990.1 primosomal protein [Myceligenerans sp. TRM 65318]